MTTPYYQDARSGATPAPTAATRPHPDACPASICAIGGERL